MQEFSTLPLPPPVNAFLQRCQVKDTMGFTPAKDASSSRKFTGVSSRLGSFYTPYATLLRIVAIPNGADDRQLLRRETKGYDMHSNLLSECPGHLPVMLGMLFCQSHRIG